MDIHSDSSNDKLNKWIREHCDDDSHAVEGGKAIPYIGWFWRNVDFTSGYIPIGDCGSFIGFMENNKWDYPERSLNEDELQMVMSIIKIAINDEDNKWEHLAKLWSYLQGRSIAESNPTDQRAASAPPASSC